MRTSGTSGRRSPSPNVPNTPPAAPTRPRKTVRFAPELEVHTLENNSTRGLEPGVLARIYRSYALQKLLEAHRLPKRNRPSFHTVNNLYGNGSSNQNAGWGRRGQYTAEMAVRDLFLLNKTGRTWHKPIPIRLSGRSAVAFKPIATEENKAWYEAAATAARKNRNAARNRNKSRNANRNQNKNRNRR